MKWDDVLDRLKDADLQPVEEIYMENYGKILTVERPEFHGRHMRCTYGVVECCRLRIEVFLFPSEGHLDDFIELIGEDPAYVRLQNMALRFPESDPAVRTNILDAISAPPR